MHDATSVWLEDVSASSFKICLRELQNFAGVHDDISVVCIFKFSVIHRHCNDNSTAVNSAVKLTRKGVVEASSHVF